MEQRTHTPEEFDIPLSLLKLSFTEHLDNQELRETIFGTTCYYCGPEYGERHLIIHRKDNSPHEPYLLWSREYLMSVNPKEWVAVCQDCHTKIHWTMDRFGVNEDFLFPD